MTEADRRAPRRCPDGWLTVTVAPIVGGEVMQLDFTGWQNFREWVELSDPGCGKVLDPVKSVAAQQAQQLPV